MTSNRDHPLTESEAEDGTLRLQLRAEQLRLRTVPEQVGAARLTTRVVERTEVIEVPLREERVVIERLPGGAEVLVDGRPLAEGEQVEVVIRRERPRIGKDVVEVERLDVRTEPLERREVVKATLRQEELVVDTRGALIAEPGSPPELST